MSYKRINFQDDVTKLNAETLNRMDEACFNNDNSIKELKEHLEENDEPYTMDRNDGSTYLFACGYPMLVDSNTNHKYDKNSSEDSVVFIYKFNVEPKMIIMDKEQASKTTVFGGYGNKKINTIRTLPSTSIIARNVQLKGLVGGNYFEGVVGKTNVIAKNCNIKNIIGAGWAGESVNGKKAEKNIVTEANVKVTDVIGLSLLYGGPQGYGVADVANVEVNGISEAEYLTAGGSNGYTREGNITINGGTIKVVQGVNRGLVDEVNIAVNGGTIENFYAGGETGDETVTGILYDSHLELNAGTINNFSNGKSNLVEFKNIEGTIADTIVTNGDTSMLTKK